MALANERRAAGWYLNPPQIRPLAHGLEAIDPMAAPRVGDAEAPVAPRLTNVNAAPRSVPRLMLADVHAASDSASAEAIRQPDDAVAEGSAARLPHPSAHAEAVHEAGTATSWSVGDGLPQLWHGAAEPAPVAWQARARHTESP
jgi:hypothetical protein